RLATGLFGGGFVEFRRDSLPGFVELLAGGTDGRSVAAFEGFFDLVHGRLHLALVVSGNLVSVVLEKLLGTINGIISLIPLLDFLASFLVVVGMRFGVLAHLLNFVLRQAAAGCDRNLLLLAGAKVLGADMQNTIGINVERDLDLRHATRSRWNVGQM